jgi:hypothetical protein
LGSVAGPIGENPVHHDLARCLAVAALALSCSGDAPVQIAAAEFKNYGDSPLEHTLYIGSDEEFHYFVWSSGKSSGHWKIEKSEMPFHQDFPLGTREAFLVTAPDGTVQPYSAGAQ